MSHTHKHLYGWTKMISRKETLVAYDFDLQADCVALLGADVDNTWATLDLSSIVPESCSGALVSLVIRDDAAGSTVYVSDIKYYNGYNCGRVTTQVANQYMTQDVIVDIWEQSLKIKSSPKPSFIEKYYVTIKGWWI